MPITCCGRMQVVKLKEQYIANLESKPSLDEDDGRPVMNRNLHAALW